MATMTKTVLHRKEEQHPETAIVVLLQGSGADLDDMRRRIEATRWPDRETVTDASEGVQLAMIQKRRALLGDGL